MNANSIARTPPKTMHRSASVRLAFVTRRRSKRNYIRDDAGFDVVTNYTRVLVLSVRRLIPI